MRAVTTQFLRMASSCLSPWSRVSTTREQYRRRPPRWCSRQIKTRLNPLSVLEALQQRQRQVHRPLIQLPKTTVGSSPTSPAFSLVEIAFTTLRAHSSLTHRTDKSCSRLTPGVRWYKHSKNKVLKLLIMSPRTRGRALTSLIQRCQFLYSRLTT